MSKLAMLLFIVFLFWWRYIIRYWSWVPKEIKCKSSIQFYLIDFRKIFEYLSSCKFCQVKVRRLNNIQGHNTLDHQETWKKGNLSYNILWCIQQQQISQNNIIIYEGIGNICIKWYKSANVEAISIGQILFLFRADEYIFFMTQ